MLIDFIKSQAPVLVLAFIVAALGYATYSRGAEQARKEQELTALKLDNAELVAERDRLKREQATVAAIDTSRVESAERVRTVTKEIIREVPKYLPSPTQPGAAAVSCSAASLPVGWWLLHNAAADGSPVDHYAATSGPDATPITPQEAAGVVIENYGICRDTADRLTHLQDYVSSVIEPASSPSVDTSSTSSGSDW